MEDKKKEDTKRILLRMNEEQKRKNPALEGKRKEANQAGISGSQQKQKLRRKKISKPPKPKTTPDEDYADGFLNQVYNTSKSALEMMKQFLSGYQRGNETCFSLAA